jgi:hypothetical protein
VALHVVSISTGVVVAAVSSGSTKSARVGSRRARIDCQDRRNTMPTRNDTWSGTVVKKSRALLDGSNLYRRLKIQLDDGTQLNVKVSRDLWQQLQEGDRLVKRQGEDPQRG